MDAFRFSPRQRQIWSRIEASGEDVPVRVEMNLTGAEALGIDPAALASRWELLRTRIIRTGGFTEPMLTLAQDPGSDAGEVQGAVPKPVHTQFRIEPTADGQRLSVTCSALLADAESVMIWSEDLLRLGQGDDESTDRRQFIDVAQWQNELLEETDPEQGSGFWEQYAEQVKAETEDAGYPVLLTGAESAGQQTIAIRLSDAVARALDRLAEEYDTDTGQVLLAAWAGLIALQFGIDGVRIGVRFDGRGLAELADIPGPLAGVVPLFIDGLGGGFPHALRQAAKAVANLRTWFHAYPAAAPEDPTFGFAWYGRLGLRQVAGRSIEPVLLQDPVHQAALRLVARPTDAGPWLGLEYDRGRIGEETATLLGERLTILLERVADDVGAGLSAADLVGPRELERLLRMWRPVADGIRAPDIARQVAHWAVHRPDAEAVRGPERGYTYAELDRTAAALAGALRSAGVKAGDVVAVYLPRSAAVVVSYLAARYAQAVCLPLDATEPVQRVADMLAVTEVAAVLTFSHLTERLPSAVAPLLLIDDPVTLEAAPYRAGSPPATMPAYILFTSGSSGVPKGVLVSHGAIANYTRSMVDCVGLDTQARFLLVSTHAADLVLTGVFPTLSAGGCVHIADEETAVDGVALAELIERHHVSWLKIVPSHLSALLDSVEDPTRLLPGRGLVLGGEAIPPGLVMTLRKLNPKCALFNHYGPTEATVGAIVHRIAGPDCLEDARDGDDGGGNGPPIGTPLPHVGAYVLDDGLRPLPIGVAGELYLGGAGLANGYWQAAMVTAGRFLPDPFSTLPGARMYRTGDRVRSDVEGRLHFLGRCDDQVKIRGFRVEPAEVEAELRRQPGIGAAVVLALPDLFGVPSLRAWVTPDAESAGPVLQHLRMRESGALENRLLLRLANGMTVAHQNEHMTRFLYNEIFVEKAYLRHGIALGPEAIILDVGANIGLFSLFAAQQSPGATVFAFEPIPSTLDVLRTNATLYPWDIRVRAVGLANRNGTDKFTHYPEMPGASGRYTDRQRDSENLRTMALQAAGAGSAGGARVSADDLDFVDGWLDRQWHGETVACEIKTLSAVIAEEGIEHIDLLKLDVEGSELDVLRGIEEADWARIRQIVMEVHGPGLLEEIEPLLQRMGFEVEIEQGADFENTGLFNLYARGPGFEAATASAAPARRGLAFYDPDALLDSVSRGIAGRLPDHMRPQNMTLVSELPYNANGKIDRARLQRIEVQTRQRLVEGVKPRNAVERVILDLWIELLGIEDLGVEDDFFAVGGHSLMAIRLTSRLRSLFALDVPLRLIFEVPTVASQAQELVTYESAPGEVAEIAAVALELQDLSPQQAAEALRQEGSA